MPELYVLYLGKNRNLKKEYSLNEEYFEGKGPIDLKVKIITTRSKNDILKEYIEFAHRSDEFRKSKKRPTEKDIIRFLNKCIKDNILSEFLQNHMEEVMSIETMLFDQDYVSEMYERELFEEGKKEGKAEGEARGITKTIITLVKKGLLNINDAAKELNISEKDLKKLLVA